MAEKRPARKPSAGRRRSRASAPENLPLVERHPKDDEKPADLAQARDGRESPARPGGESPVPVSSHAPGQIDREIDTRGILAFGFGTLAVTLAAAVLMWFLYQGLLAREEAKDRPAPAVAERDVRRLPPEPRLQPDPNQDLDEMRREEDRLLGGYAWVDREAGRVRIPIEQAKEIIAERGMLEPAAPGSMESGAFEPERRSGP